MDLKEFYIGYLPKAPSGIATLIRRVVIGLIAAVGGIAIALTSGQHRFAASFFDFGDVREFEGVLREWPNSALIIGQHGYALVGEGKHGAKPLIAALDGKSVKLRGTLIHRDKTEMIEVVAGSIQVTGQPAPLEVTFEDLGTHTLKGEIVDSKCYLGVMNPGHTKPHRECAALCIRGGIPPMFVAHDAGDRNVNLWLVSEKSEPVNEQVLEFVAEPVEVTGQISRIGDQLYFKASPATYKRLP
ncbi:MAG TPA: hypothetical protein PLK30_21075 [Blastocatellia bacterium]|nr:hypothetical protein [Blastocatellia bacterium]